MDQNNLSENIIEFNNKPRPKTKEGKDKKRDTFDSVSALYEDWELILNAFRNETFPIKIWGKRLRILTPNQMLQRLPIALTQIKAGNTSEKLLNEIRQIIYSLNREKETTTKVCKNLINSIKV